MSAPNLETGDTITAHVRGNIAKISCYGMHADGTAKVYVIYPDGQVDRMVYRDGMLAFRKAKIAKRRDT